MELIEIAPCRHALPEVGISEDECAGVEKDVEKTVSKCIEQIEKCTADKEKEILSV